MMARLDRGVGGYESINFKVLPSSVRDQYDSIANEVSFLISNNRGSQEVKDWANNTQGYVSLALKYAQDLAEFRENGSVFYNLDKFLLGLEESIEVLRERKELVAADFVRDIIEATVNPVIRRDLRVQHYTSSNQPGIVFHPHLNGELYNGVLNVRDKQHPMLSELTREEIYDLETQFTSKD